MTKRITALAITATAALSFAFTAPSAHANHVFIKKATKEYTALSLALKALFPNETVETADASELQAALSKAFADNPKLKPGNIAGEALKHAGSNAADAADEIATALKAAASLDELDARDAIKRAAAGKDLNLILVPDFAKQFFNDDPGAYALAKLVKSSKVGTGAVIGGRASQLDAVGDQASVVNLVKFALISPKVGGHGLTAAAQDIAKFVIAAADAQDPAPLDPNVNYDTAGLTKAILLSDPKLATLGAKIGTGAVAGDPTNGGNIVDTLLKEGSLPKLKSGIASFAKTVGAVADIEEISKIAIAVGTQIGIVSTANPKTTAIKFSAASGVVKSLAKAIVAKATTDSSLTNPNSFKNKQDEIAEVAAYMVGQILNVNTINGTVSGKAQVTAKSAPGKIFSLILSAVNATKGAKIAAVAPNLYTQTALDVAASVAETLGSLRDLADVGFMNDTFFDGIIALMIKKAATIGGKGNAQTISDLITAAYATGRDDRFEDGAQFNLDGTRNLSEALTSDYPETDFRLF